MTKSDLMQNIMLFQSASSTMMGGVYDRFVEKSEAIRYSKEKTELGAGQGENIVCSKI